MAIVSSIDEEKLGKGHTDHGNGKGNGHLKHQADAMADGVYEMNIDGINVSDSSGISQTSGATILVDGSKLTTEARLGGIESGNQGLMLEADNSSGRLRVNVAFDSDNQISLGDISQLSFDFTQVSQGSGSSPVYSPAFRLVIDADGDLSTTLDRGELVFEYAYQNLGATVPLYQIPRIMTHGPISVGR